MSLWIVGAGGLGREVLDTALADAVEVAGFLDEAKAGETVRGLPARSPEDAPAGEAFIVGIADPDVRERLASLMTDRGLTAATLVHPRAIVAPETRLAEGVLVLGGAYVSSSVTLGAHAHVHYNATVGHDARLDAYASVYPGANIGGGAHLEHGATVGSNACVLQGRTVGHGAFVGAGALVTHNVTAWATVAGVPARPLRKAEDTGH